MRKTILIGLVAILGLASCTGTSTSQVKTDSVSVDSLKADSSKKSVDTVKVSVDSASNLKKDKK